MDGSRYIGDLKRAARLGIAVEDEKAARHGWRLFERGVWADNMLMLHGPSQVLFALFHWHIHFVNVKQ